jgi:hypothetical protein
MKHSWQAYRYQYNIHVVGPEDKRTLERDIYSWEDNIKINLGQPGWKIWTGFILFTTGFGSQLLW